MRPRPLLIAGVVLLGSAVLLTGSPRGAFFNWLAGVAMLACPLFFIAMLLAPFLGFPMSQALQQGVQRLRIRRREIEELKYRITNLDKAHHMVELGTIYLQQGRHPRAAEWFEKALDRDATLLDQAGDRDTAREQMQRGITSVRNSPSFGRHRNGHWLWKAQ